MKKLTNKTKTLGLIGAAVSATLFSTSAMAWGPERDTYTMANPADHPTFNSITDNNAYTGAEGFDDFAIGDERDFVRIGEITPESTVLKNTVQVKPGSQYLVMVYFHNDASASLNKSKVGLALSTKMSSAFSKVVTPEQKGEVSATISSTTTTPAAVWDEAYMTSTERVMMRFVEGSAKIFNNYATNKSTLSDALFTEEGTVLGLTGWNGIIPGCEEYHGVVTYVLQAEKLNGTVTKEVAVNGGDYSDSVTVKPGDTLDYKITIKNDGDLPLQYVNLKDSLPEYLELVPGSVTFSTLDSDTPESLPDWNTAGYNFEKIGIGNGVVIRYQAKPAINYPQGLPADDCRREFVDDIVNTATLTYGSDTAEGDLRTDTATVTVKNLMDVCEEPTPTPTPTPKPEKNCKTNPEMAECQKLPNTGPVEITVAIVIVLGIIGAFFYFYKTKKMLKNVSSSVAGPMSGTENKGDSNNSDTNKN